MLFFALFLLDLLSSFRRLCLRPFVSFSGLGAAFCFLLFGDGLNDVEPGSFCSFCLRICSWIFSVLLRKVVIVSLTFFFLFASVSMLAIFINISIPLT